MQKRIEDHTAEWGDSNLAEGGLVVESRATLSMATCSNLEVEGAVYPGKKEKIIMQYPTSKGKQKEKTLQLMPSA